MCHVFTYFSVCIYYPKNPDPSKGAIFQNQIQPHYRRVQWFVGSHQNSATRRSTRHLAQSAQTWIKTTWWLQPSWNNSSQLGSSPQNCRDEMFNLWKTCHSGKITPNKSFCFRARWVSTLMVSSKKCPKSLPNPHPETLITLVWSQSSSITGICFFSQSFCRIQTISFNYRNVCEGFSMRKRGWSPVSPCLPEIVARHLPTAAVLVESTPSPGGVYATRELRQVFPRKRGYDRKIRV